MKDVVYFAPSKLDEAAHLLEVHRGKATIVAGGTDIVAKMNCYEIKPEVIIHLGALELDYIREEKGELIIGAMTPTTKISLHPLVAKKAAGLSQAAAQSGSLAVRNSATIGGNLINASPAADLAMPLLVMNARVMLAKSSGKRMVPLNQFFLGPGETNLGRDELLVEIRIPVFSGKTIFLKLGKRRAMTLSIVNTSVRLDHEDGLCKDVAIALGSVAPTPIRCYQAEASLKGKLLNSANIQSCAKIAAGETKPIDDQRATAWYRREVCSAMIERAIKDVAGILTH